ncbi:TraI domain-containing protein [Pantoea sp. GM01]|uniref:TraI domain-containing protein n=1 Tax=Pantoea sp. GM01 TaxID=1144320 RepID=UPI000270E155|nr:TraI domain-containing protein [Pantoea sp. GM01]EJL93109.1 integrating conjugative element relaxase, PFL_4751 family [Pantoea sp. GM01]
MFSKLITMISGGQTAVKPAQAGGKVPPGYFAPQPAAELLSSPHRKHLLRQIWDNTSLPEEIYNRLYLAPLKRLAEGVQNVPASAEGEWSKEGGYIDLTLKFTACSVRLAKGHMFPPGAAPEEQAAKNTLWNAVVFWSALTAHLPQLNRIEGELLDGQCWIPGMSLPGAPYRFRISNPADSGMPAMMAARLLPDDGVSWLCGDRQAMRVMASLASGDAAAMPLINEILNNARGIIGSPAGSPPAGLPAVAAAVPIADPGLPATAFPGDIISAASALAGIGSESAMGLTFGLAPVNAEPPLTADDETGSLPSALSENCGAVTEQPVAEKAADDDTTVLLSMFAAAEPAETNVDEQADRAVTATSDECWPVQDMNEQVIAIPDESLELIPDVKPQEILPFIDSVLNQASKEDVACEKSVTTAAPESSDTGNPGEQFLLWLKESINNKLLSVNEKDSMLHAVSGFMFISLPGTVFKFIEATGIDNDRRAVQASFEKNGVLHMRNDKRFFRVRIYESEGLEGKYQKRSGYLVRLSLFYQAGKNKIKDSRYILIEN